MADEVEMTPVAGAEPPKANPLGGTVHKPTVGAAPAPALKPGLKLPAQAALKPGLKLPTQNALRPGLKLPARPVIRKPGATVTARPLPKPVEAAKVPEATKPAEEQKPMETLKAVTQKLKGITQEIPQQAILRKTGIIAEDAMSEAQKEAAKHKTARISLADAMGVAPVKEEAAPMKTIRIKRPVNVPTAAPAPQEDSAAAPAAESGANLTQRKTLKISRPTGATVKPTGKFGIKRPVPGPTAGAPAPAQDPAQAVDDIADIPDIPSASAAPVPMAPADEGPAWAWALSAIVQAAACVAMGALLWFLYENSQLPTFCGGLGWGA